jgi:sulfide:quinone oxidoreductase
MRRALAQEAPHRQRSATVTNRTVDATAESTLMWDRWVNDGGASPPQAVADREYAAVTANHEARQGRRRVGRDRPLPRRRRRQSIVIAGAGVAALETLLALRALRANVDVTLVAPGPRFVDHSMLSRQPFAAKRVRGLHLERVAEQLDARWQRGSVDRVERHRGRIVTTDGSELAYDALVLAVGARPLRAWDCDGVLTYRDGRDASSFRLLLRRLRDGSVQRVAFVRPPGPTWPMPLYDLAFMTATDCATHGCSDARLSIVTPESAPLAAFGTHAGAEVGRLLEQHGVALHASSYAAPGPGGRLEVRPGDRRLEVDRIVTQPRLVGPRLRGVPCERDGFIHTDAYGRVHGLEGVFAAGDATSFPVKQGGLATQQADVVAEVIAAGAGVDVEPRPFRPVLRGVLPVAGEARFMRADISGRAGDDSILSREPMWTPANKVYGRYLAAYLGRQVGDADDVREPRRHRARVPSAAAAG